MHLTTYKLRKRNNVFDPHISDPLIRCILYSRLSVEYYEDANNGFKKMNAFICGVSKYHHAHKPRHKSSSYLLVTLIHHSEYIRRVTEINGNSSETVSPWRVVRNEIRN
jgi:hypothetical protein